jgi:hypothetical protein
MLINSWKRPLEKIRIILIGIGILVIVLLLEGCVKTEYVCTEIPLEPINCINNIKTPLDMAKCLEEYKLRDKVSTGGNAE